MHVSNKAFCIGCLSRCIKMLMNEFYNKKSKRKEAKKLTDIKTEYILINTINILLIKFTITI